MTLKCENFHQRFDEKVSFDFSYNCHKIVGSIFDDLINPINVNSTNEHSFYVTESTFTKISNNSIIINSAPSKLNIQKSCFSNGKGFQHKKYNSRGMVACAFCELYELTYSSFTLFDGYGSSSNLLSKGKDVVKYYNESLNKLTGYSSLYIELSESSISYITLANSSGTTTGIEFNSALGKSSELKKSNFIKVVVFEIPDANGNPPGIIVTTSVDTSLIVDNLFFVDCCGTYFANRYNSPQVVATNIYCDESIVNINIIKFSETLDIGNEIANCFQGCSKSDIQIKKMIPVVFSFFINIIDINC